MRTSLRSFAAALLFLPAALPAHEVHSTHTRAVVENGAVMWKVRLFSDDLEKGLRAYARRPTFALDRDPKADSLFTAYFNAKVSVSANGRALTASLVQQGIDKDPIGGTVQWYLMQFNAGRAPTSLSIRNALLAELFPSQANIVVLLSMPGEKRHSLYFGDGDMAMQTVDLRR